LGDIKAWTEVLLKPSRKREGSKLREEREGEKYKQKEKHKILINF
jgi:hypothetical protein